jgi:hypothetical protein
MAITLTKSAGVPRSKFAGIIEDAEWDEEEGGSPYEEDPTLFLPRGASMIPPEAVKPDDQANLAKLRTAAVPLASAVLVLNPRFPGWLRWVGAGVGLYSLLQATKAKQTAVQGYGAMKDCGCGCGGAGTCR